MVKKIKNEAEFAEVLEKDMALVDFSATWCGPCQMIAPVLEEVSEEMTDVDFYNVDCDELPDLAAKYAVMSIPALVLLKKGVKSGMSVGFIPKEQIEDFIK